MTLINSVAETRLESFFGGIGALLGNDARRASFATYAQGLLSEGERKSVEPISSRACVEPHKTDAAHQRLLHFVSSSNWSDREVRSFAANHALTAIRQRGKIDSWIVDDTGFLKQGKHSVGVQRQYTGSAGKITNCQIGVSLTIATPTDHVPIDFELYLPKLWAEDPDRRAEARIPDSVVFKTKLQLALDMIHRAVADEIPPGVLLADAAYGTSSEFRREIRRLGLHYGVGVDPKTNIFEVDEAIEPGGNAISVRDLAFKLKARKSKYRRCNWREGTKETLTARFAMRRVFACKDQEHSLPEREPIWLLVEWRDGEEEPSNYFLCSLPKTTRLGKLVRTVMQRWRTERAYEDLKGELGLDHYEGRRFQGWHHHISVVLCCYAFVISERVRHFPPSARGSIRDQAHSRAA